uniref:Uncharacterized protein n=1 Tax=Panagrolaimus sp. ES5 TaxID=591445 RepID=A0AC34FVK8_9BILA
MIILLGLSPQVYSGLKQHAKQVLAHSIATSYMAASLQSKLLSNKPGVLVARLGNSAKQAVGFSSAQVVAFGYQPLKPVWHV